MAIPNKNPLSHWLKWIALESRSGVLKVNLPTASARFYFVLGEIRAVADLKSTPRPPESVDAVRWITEFLLELARAPEADVTFSEVQSPPPDAMLARIDPRRILVQLASSGLDAAVLRETLSEAGRRFVAVPAAGLEACAQLLSSDEAYVMSRLDAPLTLEEILSVSPWDEAQTLGQLYALFLLGLVDTVPPQEPPQTESTPLRLPIAVPASALSEPAQSSSDQILGETEGLNLRREIEEQDYLNHGNYYDLLRVSRSASEQEIKSSYYVLAKKFHPDRYRSQLSPELLQKLDRLFCHLSEAYETLSNPARRLLYDEKLLAATPSAGRQAAETDRAGKNFASGKRLFDEGQFQECLPYLKEAVKLKPDVARYHALLGRALARFPKRRKEAEEHLSKSVELEPQKALHYVALGMLYKEIHLALRARRMFEQALELDPANKTALRELGDPSRPMEEKKEKALSQKLRKLFKKR